MRRQCHVTQKAPPKSLHGIAITLEKCFGLMISLSPHFQVSQQIPVHIRGIKTGRLQRQLGEYPNNGLQASMMTKLHEMPTVSQTMPDVFHVVFRSLGSTVSSTASLFQFGIQTQPMRRISLHLGQRCTPQIP